MNENYLVKAIIIDLGKTLMYIPENYDLESRIATLTGQPRWKIVALIYDICNHNLGMSADEFIEFISRNLNEDKNPDFDKELRTICLDSIKEAKLQPDALDSLSILRSRGFKLTLVSNTSPLSKPRVNHLDLNNYFDHIVFSCDVGYLKPDPRIFMHAIKLMGESPESTCIIGDRIRTIILGGAILGANLVLVERRLQKTHMSEQLPVYAIVPDLNKLVDLPLFNIQ